MTASPYLERHFNSKDGLKLYYRDYPGGNPDATPLLALHGLTRNSKDFADIAERLSTHRRVLAPDMRGRGNSAYDPDSNHYQIPVYAADVLALLEDCYIAKVIILGTSMGGLIAMTLAALKPEILAAVILNDIGPELDPKGLARILSYTGKTEPAASWTEAAARIRDINQSAFPDYGPEDWLTFAHATFKATPDGRMIADYDPRIMEPLAKSSDAAAPADLWPLFDKLKTVPLLALRGEISDLFSVKTLNRMATGHPGMQQATIPGRGHAPSLKEPESRAALHDFLKNL